MTTSQVTIRDTFLLTAPPSQFGLDTVELFSSVAASTTRNVENVGDTFHAWQMRKLKLWTFPIMLDPLSDEEDDEYDYSLGGAGDPDSDVDLSMSGPVNAEEPVPELSQKERDRKKAEFTAKRSKKVKKGNFYALLGLEDKEMDATKMEIKKAYRKISLVAHPDKAAPEDREEAQERFKAIQEAYEHLSDDYKRRVYDSTLEFDDSVPSPSEVTGPDSFFWVYAPVFKRNGRFSEQKCPSIGDMDTPLREVEAFYEWWFYQFKSWRDFASLHEFDPEEAESRDEKRWMERENRLKTKSAKKEEASRVRKFVQDAEKLDPRLRKERERVAEQARLKKEARAKLQRDKAEEKARLLEEEKANAEQARLQALADKEIAKQQKQIMKKARSSLRKAHVKELLLEPVGRSDVDAELFDIFLLSCDFKLITELSEALAESKPSLGELILAAYSAHEEKQEEKKRVAIEKQAQMKMERKQQEEIRLKSKEWTIDEESMLAKGIQKYPGGHGNRWELILQMINTVGDRTIKEIHVKVRMLEMNSQKQTSDEKNYARYLASMSGKTAASGPTDQSLSETDYERLNRLNLAKPSPAATSSSPTNSNSTNNLASTPTSPTKKIKKKIKKKTKPTGGDTPGSDKATPTGTASSSTPGKTKKVKKKSSTSEKKKDTVPAPAQPQVAIGEWTATQQAAFEKALRDVAKDVPDRWGAIAECVPGKTKKECVKRFKEIRAMILAQQKAR